MSVPTPDSADIAGPPAVVAVVPTCDPGPWFGDTLDGLAAQDYPNLSVLVIDAGSTVDPTPLVSAALPSAFVRRLDRRAGFAETANEALDAVEGATFLLFCHDDCQLMPGSVQGLVSEAFRENAGIVGAKLLDWDHPDRLRSMGARIDKFGSAAPLIEPGELDQAQHDATTEVAVCSTAAMLVRADLFEDLGGFSTDIDGSGEDLDLCWRARVAGARTFVTPAGSARHRELATIGDPDALQRRRALRHQARIMLAAYSPIHLVRVIPQAVVASILDVLLNLITGRFRHAGDVVSAWVWNVRHLPTTWRIHRRVGRSRHSTDSEIRSTQIEGSVRLRSYVGSARSMGERRLPAAIAAAREMPGNWQDGSGPAAALGFVVLVLFVLVAGRGLFGDGLSVIREFVPVDGVSALVRGWWSGWSDMGLGHQGPVPPINLAVGLLTVLCLGSASLARTLMVLAPFVIAPVGTWRALRDVMSTRSRLVASVVTVVVAVPHDAAGEGRLQALAIYAAMPWLLGRYFRMTGIEPFDVAVHRSPARQGMGLGLVAAATFVFAPVVALVLVGLGVAMVIGSVVGGRPSAAYRVVIGTGSALLTIALVQLPSTIDLLGRSDRWWSLVGSSAPLPEVTPTNLLRLSSGTTTGGWLLLAVPIAALVPLLVARQWRLRWAAQCWIVALGSLAVIVAIARWGSIAFAPSLPLLLAPAAVALALATGFGSAALESDLVGRTFGWRQPVAVLGAGAFVFALIPALASLASGRFDLPEGDVVAAVAGSGGRDAALYRTLWLGAPDQLPMRGREILPGLAMATTTALAPSIENLSPPQPGVGDTDLALIVRETLEGGSARLGRRLAPFGVSHIIVVTDPTAAGGDPTPAVAEAKSTLEAQLDLQQVSIAPGLGVFESSAAAAVRRTLSSAEADAEANRPATAISTTDPPAGTPGFRRGEPPVSYDGRVAAGRAVVLATQGRTWRLVAGDRDIGSRPFQGWAQRFRDGGRSAATLEFDSPFRHRVLLIGQLLLVLIAMGIAHGRTPVGPVRRPTEAEEPTEADEPTEAEA